MRLEERDPPSRLLALAAPVLAVLLTAILGSGLVAWAGAPVGQAYALLLDGAFGSRFAITETLTRACPLILTGLAAALAFRARFYNIGAEGQLYLGALCAVLIGGQWAPALADVPAPVLFGLMLAGGACAGALWVLPTAWLRNRLGVDEVVTTLLLNFVALLLVSLLLDGPMKDPMAMGWPQSVSIDPALEFDRLVERSRLHSGLLLALGLAVATWVMQRYSVLGFQMQATGVNPVAARFIGIPTARMAMLAALMSGALAGLAGVGEVAGRAGYVTLDMSPGYGYSGIVIAMLAQGHPLGVIAASVFVAGMLVGADSMSRVLAVPSYLADVMVAIALLAMLVTAMLARWRLRRS